MNLRFSFSQCGYVAALTMAGALVLSGCKSELDEKTSAKVTEVAKGAAKQAVAKLQTGPKTKLTLDTGSSSIGWLGAKVTGDHKGTLQAQSGKVTLAGDAPSRLEVTVDMATVTSDAEKLTTHLKSPDFFDVDKFPTAKFVATEFKPGATPGAFDVTGELTLHGVTKQLTFPATVQVSDGSASGKAEFKINRQDFGIKYPGKPDDLIRDDVALTLDLSFAGAAKSKPH